MANTWSGWENQFCKAAGILGTPPIFKLLDQWAAHATSVCKNNPIDMTAKVAGSSACHANTGINTPTQKYDTHGHAARAFDREIHEPWAAALLRALNTGNPYQVSYANDVASVFFSWGSPDMASAYLNTAGQSSGGGGGGSGGGKSTRAHSGWDDLRRSINRNMPHALKRAHRNHRAALRSLSRARKVRL